MLYESEHTRLRSRSRYTWRCGRAGGLTEEEMQREGTVSRSGHKGQKKMARRLIIRVREDDPIAAWIEVWRPNPQVRFENDDARADAFLGAL